MHELAILRSDLWSTSRFGWLWKFRFFEMNCPGVSVPTSRLGGHKLAVEFPLISGLGTFRPTSEPGILFRTPQAEVPFRAPVMTHHPTKHSETFLAYPPVQAVP